MADSLNFVVYGLPQPQGSAKAFYRPGMKHPVVTSDNTKLKPWRQEVTACALAALDTCKHFSPFLHKEPVTIEATFYFPRPASHTKRQRAVPFVATKPDLDKILRSLGDSLTGVAFKDDAQIAEVTVRKLYGDIPRTEVTVRAATGGAA